MPLWTFLLLGQNQLLSSIHRRLSTAAEVQYVAEKLAEVGGPGTCVEAIGPNEEDGFTVDGREIGPELTFVSQTAASRT